MRTLSTAFITLSVLWLAPSPFPALAEEEAVRGVRVLDEVWSIARDHFLDPGFNGVDWAAARERYREEAAGAATSAELSSLINRMLGELGTSHTAYYTPEQVEYHHLRDIFRRAFRTPGATRTPEDTPGYTALLYLANADVLVDGIRLEGTGVEPDVLVPFDVRYCAGNDPQFEKAIEIAATLAASPEP